MYVFFCFFFLGGGGGGGEDGMEGVTYIVVVADQYVLPWLRLTRLPETRET